MIGEGGLAFFVRLTFLLCEEVGGKNESFCITAFLLGMQPMPA